MRIGLYFGSFNPIHVGHLIIASTVANSKEVDQVWFIVSPQNPLKKSASLLNEYHRLHLVQLAIEQDPLIRVSDIEFKLPRPSYTVDTLAYLKEKYPSHTFTIIIGSDSLLNLHKWKNGELLLREHCFLVYQRPKFEVQDAPKSVQVVDAPLLDISSTQIRELIRSNKSIRYLVPDNVREEIGRNNYYKPGLKNES